MPKSKSTVARKKVATSEFPRFNLNKSYVGLLYGIATVVVLFVVVFLGLRSNVNRQGDVSDDAARTTQEQQEQLSQNGTYTTVEGDTLWSIAEAKYKSGYNWVDIAKANNITNPSALEAGTKLTIPVVTPILIAQEVNTTMTPMPTVQVQVSTPTPTITTSAPTEIPADPIAPAATITGSSYVVVRDDNLWSIAERAYGDGFKWTEIAKANSLAMPGIIHSGNQLKLPR